MLTVWRNILKITLTILKTIARSSLLNETVVEIITILNFIYLLQINV